MPEFKAIQRKMVRVSQEQLVRTRFLEETGEPLPLVVEPNAEKVDLLGWASAHRAWIEEQLVKHGALLFRGFDVASPERFRQLGAGIFTELLDYKERAAPRIEVSPGIYTSTEFPPDQWIPHHHEMSYSHNWPAKLLFYCDLPPESRGRTPLASERMVTGRLDPAIQRAFREKGVMYVRNYGEGVDLSWRDAFQTDDRTAVEDYCRRCGMEAEWRDGDRLRTRAVRQVVATHPKTGETLWFNHAHMFHHSNLQPEVREVLLAQFREDELPRNAFYGDGSPIESSVLEEVRQTYHDSSVAFSWQKGDVLIVDNFLVTHGREPFTGPRRILVAMAELYTHPDLRHLAPDTGSV